MGKLKIPLNFSRLGPISPLQRSEKVGLQSRFHRHLPLKSSDFAGVLDCPPHSQHKKRWIALGCAVAVWWGRFGGGWLREGPARCWQGGGGEPAVDPVGFAWSLSQPLRAGAGCCSGVSGAGPLEWGQWRRVVAAGQWSRVTGAGSLKRGAGHWVVFAPGAI